MRMLRRLTVALELVLAVSLLVDGSARADAADAERHHAAAQRLVGLGDYPGAIAELEEAYAADKRPEILREIGDLYRRRADRDRAEALQAASYYRRYLAARPDAPDRAAVDKQLAEVEAIALKPPPPVEKPAPPPPPLVPAAPPGPSPRPVLGGALVGAGGASLVAGIVLLAVSGHDYGRADDERTLDARNQVVDAANREAVVGGVLLGVGVVAAAAGALVMLWRERAEHRADVHLVSTRNGAALGFAW